MRTSVFNRALFVLACAGALWLGPVSLLSAQSADLTAYDEALKQAVEAHRAQRWVDAHELFGRAHALYPNARTLRGLGVSAFEAGQHALALRDLEAALVHAERPLPPDLRASVEALVAHLRQQVGVYLFRLQPEGAQLLIDDVAPIVSPRGEVLLEPGRHRAVVSLEGHVAQTLELDAHGGDRSEMHVALVPASLLLPLPSDAQREVERPSPPVLAPRVDGAWSWQRKSAVVTGSVGLASLASWGALYGAAHLRVRDLEDDCRGEPGGGCTGTREALAEERGVPRLLNASTATLVVGGALVAVSAVLFTLDWRARKKSAVQSALALRFNF
jgi:hypothetical protein